MKNRIRVLRAEKDMTQEQLAELIGVHPEYDYFHGERKYCPSIKLGFRIANVFGVGIDDVFTYEEEIDGPSHDDE